MQEGTRVLRLDAFLKSFSFIRSRNYANPMRFSVS